MEFLSKEEAFSKINVMTDEELIELLNQLDLPYDIVNGELINKEMIIQMLTGVNPTPNVRITYTWKGEKQEQKIEAGKGGCLTCGG